MAQSRAWCGTLQLDNDEFDGLVYLGRLFERELITYGVGQVEMGSHLHFQFYVQCGSPKRLAWMKGNVDGHAHWEAARGTGEQNKKYCTKEETRIRGPWEVGQMTRQGQSKGLQEATELVCSGVQLQDVAERFPLVWVRHGRGLCDLRRQLALDQDRRVFGPDGPELWVLWGPSGTGKSRYVAEHWPDAFWKPPYHQWWDGYTGCETVVLDDFQDGSMRLTDLQRLLDWYPLWVEVKGGSIPMLAKRYVITSNNSPEWWYLKSDTHRTIMRRVNDFAARFGRLLEFPLPGAAAEHEATPEPTERREGFAEVIPDWRDPFHVEF